jgi:hypothetical protein
MIHPDGIPIRPPSSFRLIGELTGAGQRVVVV